MSMFHANRACVVSISRTLQTLGIMRSLRVTCLMILTMGTGCARAAYSIEEENRRSMFVRDVDRLPVDLR